MSKRLYIEAKWIGEGELPDVDPDLIAREVVAYLEGMLIELRDKPDWADAACVTIDFSQLEQFATK